MNIIRKILYKMSGKVKFNSLDYWESRYKGGGNSGDGSYGRLAEFKANFINRLIIEKEIHSVIELGCGDGNQLSLMQYKQYIGLDVSETIIDSCRTKYLDDKTKKFILYNPKKFRADSSLISDVALSLDVLYHIVEEDVYQKYLNDLFSLAKRFVIIYSTNYYFVETQHVLHRKFSVDVGKHFKNWKLSEHVVNPFLGNGDQQSMADFFVFEYISNDNS